MQDYEIVMVSKSAQESFSDLVCSAEVQGEKTRKVLFLASRKVKKSVLEKPSNCTI